MKNYIIVFLTFLVSLKSFGQPPKDREEKFEQLQAAKIAYITKELDLSPSQAEKFWPIYHEYSKERKEIRKKIRKIRHEHHDEMNNLSEKQLEEEIGKMFSLKQKELDLDIKYKDQLLEVISAKQLLMLYKAEKEFLRKLQDRIHHRPERGPDR